jgi:hypothetical protein
MSFNLKLNQVNFNCAPLLTEGFNGTETLGYMCKSNRTIEGFYQSAPEYDNGKVYQLGDMVTKDGVVYKMIDGIGAPGYPPPRPTNWQPQNNVVSNVSAPEYDNGKVYQLGDMVTKDGVVYKMTDGIGAAGYPPPRPTNWTPQGPARSNNAVAARSVAAQNVPADNAKATFYVHCDYQGQSFSLGPGRHDINQMGIPNDSLSSIKIPSGLKVTIFEHGGFQGRSLSMTADEPCLAKRNKDGLNFNDQTSGIIIERVASNENLVKFVRVDGGSDYLQLSQVVVTDENGANIAKGRKTSSSGVGWDGPESAAVDGTEASRGHPAQYHSNNGNAFFQIELSVPSKVVSVTIYNRADCCQSRLASGYRVKLLNAQGQVMVTSKPLNAEAKQVITF